MNDRLLKESDVLKAIDKRIEELSKDPVFIRKNGIIDIVGVKKYISAIPSADRPRGEWIKKPHKVYLPRDCEPLLEEMYNEADHSIIEYWWHCNQCDYEADRLSKPTFKFCPNCGARMKGINNEGYDI